MIPMDRPLVIADTVQATQAEEEIIVLDLHQERFYGLDGVGAEVWRGIAEGKTPDAIIAALGDAYDVPADTLRTDVCNLLEHFQQKVWIRVAPTG